MSTSPGEELNTIAAALKLTEQRLGSAAPALPAQLSKLLSAALSLQSSAFLRSTH
jgi:hypothetical protein